MSKVLTDLVEQSFTNEDCRKVIRSATAVLDVSESYNTGRLDRTIVEEVKKYYAGIDLPDLLLLWHDNYNTLMFSNGMQKPDNETHFLVRHKVVALGIIINENF